METGKDPSQQLYPLFCAKDETGKDPSQQLYPLFCAKDETGKDPSQQLYPLFCAKDHCDKLSEKSRIEQLDQKLSPRNHFIYRQTMTMIITMTLHNVTAKFCKMFAVIYDNES